MTFVGDRYISVPNLSLAWLEAVRLLLNEPSGKTVHLVLRILNPVDEIDVIRKAAQELIDTHNADHAIKYETIETTRNTIFPAAWARRNPEPADLAAYYRTRYTKYGLRGFRNNEKGTYFGRIVAYPRPGDGEFGDQLTDTVRKLRLELNGSAPKSSRYEINIYDEATDKGPMSFPCMAHLSVHVHGAKLHMQVIYRNETFIGRAYGNYLGLAELQAYIAQASGLDVGELLVTVGHAELEGGNKRAAQSMIARVDSEIARTEVERATAESR